MSTRAGSLRAHESWTSAIRTQPTPPNVVPANAGIQPVTDDSLDSACAGMTAPPISILSEGAPF